MINDVFNGVGFSEINLINEAPTTANESRNLRIIRWRNTAQRWRFSFETVPLEPAEYRRVFCALVNIQNKAASFDFIHPIFSYGQGNPGTSAQARAPVAAGSLQIPVKGLPANRKRAFVAGDPVRFAGHTKVYLVQSDTDADKDGNATITLNSHLQRNVEINGQITANEVPFYLQLDGNPLEIEIDNSNKRLLQLSFEAVEDLTQ